MPNLKTLLTRTEELPAVQYSNLLCETVL